ncbi:MAG: glycosyltransferase family 4 protein [Acidimicrobiales bacterium]
MFTEERPPTRIAMDVTALLGSTTGVGQMVKQLASRLPRYPSVELTGLIVSWRGRSRLGHVIPPGWHMKPLPLPARLTHAGWRRFDRPRLNGFDLVHGPNYIVPPTDGAARLVTVHDLTAWRFPELVDSHSQYYPKHLLRAVAEGADIHAVSSFVADEIEAELGVDRDRIHVIRNGYEPIAAGDADRGRSLVGAPYVLAIGTIEPRKDFVTLVRAMAAIWPIFPDIKLVIAGANGWGTEELDEVIEELGVADRIKRLGYVSDPVKADLLVGSELLAYPSVYEGFGLPLLEAMGAGVPVVSTSAGAIPEIAGRAAVLVEPRDPSALAGALLSVLEDDGLRRQPAEAGRQQVIGYSWDQATEEMISTYHRLSGGRVELADR